MKFCNTQQMKISLLFIFFACTLVSGSSTDNGKKFTPNSAINITSLSWIKNCLALADLEGILIPDNRTGYVQSFGIVRKTFLYSIKETNSHPVLLAFCKELFSFCATNSTDFRNYVESEAIHLSYQHREFLVRSAVIARKFDFV